ncbi:MAG: prepilin-type N-terminal cleavage/methylation domain-containing protein [Oscillospiraceae bacterium]|nr:prepilin-type N-terminal cleavage/methylation domain-containing protein [Oscillospiraceae bacterium]
MGTVKNNKGVTLIELVVCIVIVGIVAGITSLSIYNVFSAQARKCANEMDYLLSQCRIDSMSRAGAIYLRLSCDRNGNVIAENMENGAVLSSHTIGNSRCHVTYETDREYELNSQNLCLSFQRDTGSLRTLLPDGSADAGSQCISITVSGSGGAGTYQIHLVPATGMHTLEG